MSKMFFICIYCFTIGHTSLIHNVPCPPVHPSPITIVAAASGWKEITYISTWPRSRRRSKKSGYFLGHNVCFLLLLPLLILSLLVTTIIHFLHFIKTVHWRISLLGISFTSLCHLHCLPGQYIRVSPHRFIIFDWFPRRPSDSECK